jgi:O-succinylbenzoate synthase
MSVDVADLPIHDGSITLSELDIKLDGLDVAPDRYEWWKNRAMRCAEVLGLS